MNTQWTGQASGFLADQVAGNLNDAVELPLNEQLRDRWSTVNRILQDSLPPPPKAAAPPSSRDFLAEFPGLGAFGAQGQGYRQQMLTRRANLNPETAKASSWVTGIAPAQPSAPIWSDHSRGPGVQGAAGYPNQPVPDHMPPAVDAFQRIASQYRSFHTDLARAR